MRPSRLVPLALAIATVVVVAMIPPTPAHAQPSNTLAADVNEAIRRGVAFLREQQENDGRWSHPPVHNLGATALSGLALLESGVPEDDPAIVRASSFVRSELSNNDHTYDISLTILFLSRLSRRGDEETDRLIRRLAARLDAGGNEGFWSYLLPPEEQMIPGDGAENGARVATRARARRQAFMPRGQGDNSNTQFALLGLWAAGRHGYDSNEGLRAIERHFRSTLLPKGAWGYHPNQGPRNSMTCAGLMALAISSARPEEAEKYTAKARGALLAADPVYQQVLETITNDARNLDKGSDVYYLWSLERVCVALALRKLDDFDWYEAGARELVRRQQADGGWPGTWGRIPCTSFALLFLRRSNLAFELDRVLKVPNHHDATPDPEPVDGSRVEDATAAGVRPTLALTTPNETSISQPGAEEAPTAGDGPAVVVTGANDSNFPEIAVDFELRDESGGFVLDGLREDFKVFEEGRELPIERFLSPYGDPQPITVVLVVDRSSSMEEEDRIGALKSAVATFLGGLPKGSKVAVVAFGSEVVRICPFTDDFAHAQETVNRLRPAGATRYYDAVADALELIQPLPGRRAILALTDGEDTFSQSASLETVTVAARRLGLPVHTLGLGSEDEIESVALKALASGTRGQYYPAREAEQLRKIYQQLAERLRSSYTLVYRSDRKIPDGTLRPVRLTYRKSRQAGETAVFVPGMVVPAPGWSRLFLLLLAVLAVLFARGGTR